VTYVFASLGEFAVDPPQSTIGLARATTNLVQEGLGLSNTRLGCFDIGFSGSAGRLGFLISETQSASVGWLVDWLQQSM
jgi:hypothetical protein